MKVPSCLAEVMIKNKLLKKIKHCNWGTFPYYYVKPAISIRFAFYTMQQEIFKLTNRIFNTATDTWQPDINNCY